jgi:PEGA domain
MKKIILTILLLLLLTTSVFAAGYGKLTVVTDLPRSTIFIDGKNVGNDAIQAYPVEEGEHYVTVFYRGKKIYAKILKIYEGDFKTITSAHFVDFKTNVASRGAIDQEAARIRETRGNMAFGVFGSSPAQGLSWKWWFTEKLGIQTVGYLSSYDDKVNNQFGARILFHFADKVVNNAPFTAYLALGGGTAYYKDTNKADSTLIGEGAFGIETGFLNLYWSLELGMEKRVVTHTNNEDSDTVLNNMKYSVGLHYYF